MIRSGAVCKCGHCGYEGPCYGIPHTAGISAPFCYRCGRNGGLEAYREDTVVPIA